MILLLYIVYKRSLSFWFWSFIKNIPILLSLSISTILFAQNNLKLIWLIFSTVLRSLFLPFCVGLHPHFLLFVFISSYFSVLFDQYFFFQLVLECQPHFLKIELFNEVTYSTSVYNVTFYRFETRNSNKLYSTQNFLMQLRKLNLITSIYLNTSLSCSDISLVHYRTRSMAALVIYYFSLCLSKVWVLLEILVIELLSSSYSGSLNNQNVVSSVFKDIEIVFRVSSS